MCTRSISTRLTICRTSTTTRCGMPGTACARPRVNRAWAEALGRRQAPAADDATWRLVFGTEPRVDAQVQTSQVARQGCEDASNKNWNLRSDSIGSEKALA